MRLRDESLWAITSYFNPMSYDRRRQNYQQFRNALSVPLLVVELSDSDHYEIQADDAEIVVRAASRSVLWQKERLLNVALRHLPAHVEQVAWLDCDVIFERPDWPDAAAAELRKRPLIQLFSLRVDLPREQSQRGNQPTGAVRTRGTVAKQTAIASGSARAPAAADAKSILQGAPGLAWAGRRELLDKHGFYDRMVMGSGDLAMICAAFGSIAVAAEATRLNEARYKHYESWAAAFQRDVGADVGYLEGRVFHLWHGEMCHRYYGRRHVEFARMAFDPRIDLRVNDTGAFEWADERDDLNRFAVEYFRSRLEDGR